MVKRGLKPQQAAKIRAEKGLQMTKLQKLRVKKGYSQNDLAELAGISVSTIKQYEQQVRPIDSARLDTLCALCLSLGCGISDILEDKHLIARLKKCEISKNC